jgi:predicted transcriptional regulator
MVMWLRFVRHIPADGISVRNFRPLTSLPLKNLIQWLKRMSKWWGYLTVDKDRIIRLSPGGRKARATWEPLAAEIERRWEDRYGETQISQLRSALFTIARQLDPTLPDYMPILVYGLVNSVPERRAAFPLTEKSPLPALIARVLLAFALEFEAEAPISLAIFANCLRCAANSPKRLRDLPREAGISKTAVQTSASFLVKKGFAIVKNEGGAKTLTLTPKGQDTYEKSAEQIQAVEKAWRGRFGKGAIDSVRSSLEALISEPLSESTVFAGLHPCRDCWRAKVPQPETLPQFPLVLHRGGYPDGS